LALLLLAIATPSSNTPQIDQEVSAVSDNTGLITVPAYELKMA